MRTLAIDTAGYGGSVALLDDDRLLGGLELPAGAQAERLPGAIEELLAERGWAPSGLELVAVSLGPGSFTGVRIGLAAAQGLTFGLDIPLVGVTNLELLAAWSDLVLEGQGGLYVALMDARRGEYYLAAFRPGEAGAAPTDSSAGRLISVVAPSAVARTDLRITLEPYLDGLAGPLVLCGDGVPLAAPDLVHWPEDRRTVNPPRPGDAATLLGRLGGEAFRREGAPPLLEPLYLRAPDARRPARVVPPPTVLPARGPSAGASEGV